MVEAWNNEKSEVLLKFLLLDDCERYRDCDAMKQIGKDACQRLADEFQKQYPDTIPCYSAYFIDSWCGFGVAKKCNRLLYNLLLKSNRFVSEIGFINVELKNAVAIECNHSIIEYAQNICDVSIRIFPGLSNFRYIWDSTKRIFWTLPFVGPYEFHLYYTILHDWFSLFDDLKPLSGITIYKALIEKLPKLQEGFHWETCAIPDKRRKL
jgi:hypothetical protein